MIRRVRTLSFLFFSVIIFTFSCESDPRDDLSFLMKENVDGIWKVSEINADVFEGDEKVAIESIKGAEDFLKGLINQKVEFESPDIFRIGNISGVWRLNALNKKLIFTPYSFYIHPDQRDLLEGLINNGEEVNFSVLDYGSSFIKMETEIPYSAYSSNSSLKLFVKLNKD
ncbi:hypothetical protein [Aureibacter tunicatorum]|uniref:Lipocalin-like domain-containing protein n=1 Tax=Aureibacter tunicatorum TaxID=866807 RepID=A0AAE3XMI4_9BACT|nr:hypothetical protein [Aureibacter tunicatorum]MDR6237709.1 hypothetical protein [Aureibacter tunicatorum]BDD02744.1 hypothetical protein AUTU_02270 [Aureibacter tunicatorum]